MSQACRGPPSLGRWPTVSGSDDNDLPSNGALVAPGLRRSSCKRSDFRFDRTERPSGFPMARECFERNNQCKALALSSNRSPLFLFRQNSRPQSAHARPSHLLPRNLISTIRKTRKPRSSAALDRLGNWSGRRDSNPRPQPWQGCALPLSYTRSRGPNQDKGAASRAYMAEARGDCNREIAAFRRAAQTGLRHDGSGCRLRRNLDVAVKVPLQPIERFGFGAGVPFPAGCRGGGASCPPCRLALKHVMRERRRLRTWHARPGQHGVRTITVRVCGRRRRMFTPAEIPCRRRKPNFFPFWTRWELR